MSDLEESSRGIIAGMPYRRGSLLLPALICVALGGWATVGQAEGGACGRPGKPPCPLQRWMRVRVAAPMARGEHQQLARSLERLVQMNPEPDKWQNWNRFAREGAARARDGRDVESSCTRCHRVYRAKYNDKYRERPVAPPRGHDR